MTAVLARGRQAHPDVHVKDPRSLAHPARHEALIRARAASRILQEWGSEDFALVGARELLEQAAAWAGQATWAAHAPSDGVAA